VKVAIIGNGISGITAARHIRKHTDSDIVVISKESKHFYSRTALMYIYMGHMRYKDTKPYEDWFWEKNRIDLLQNYVSKVNTTSKEIIFENGKSRAYDKLIIASGSKSNFFGWPGQDLKGVQGLYNLQDLESLETYSKDMNHAVIVGGGLIGIELAEMLHSRNVPVTFLVRESSFWNNVLPAGESEIINKHIKAHGYNLILSKNLEKINGDENGRVKSITIKETGEEISCNFVGITAGVSPNINFLKDSEIETKRGVLVDAFFETNVKDVFAIGDCAEFRNPLPGRRPIEQVWYTGRMQAERLAMNICKEKGAYKPGPWFNSAKFLDIEYQTYGVVMPRLRENEESIYWEHQDNDKCMHMVYDKTTKEFIGLNLLGIRMRHHLFDKWLREKRSIEYVLENLKAANFDPEFYAMYGTALLSVYNKKEGKNIQTKTKRLFKSVLKLMKND